MKITEKTIFNYIKSSNEHFSFYSESLQKEIVKKIFNQAVLEQPENESDLEATLRLQILVQKVILQKPGKSQIPLPENTAEASLISMLLADPEWNKKNTSWEEVSSLLSAVLWEKDPKVFQMAKTWIQDKLKVAKEEVPCARMRKIYMHNLLSYYPFFSPEKGEKLYLPIESSDTLVGYEVEPIELTPFFLGSPLMAYGLVPKDSKNPPLLLFKGTTFPTDDGYYQSLLTDINPFAAVGSYAFQSSAKYRIENWLKKQTSKVEVMGASLGGALSLQTASYFPEYVKSVHAFNSPAMTSLEINKWKEKKAKLSKKEIPEVNVYLQNSDPISSFVGRCFAPDWKIHHVHAPIDHPFQAHAAAYTAHKEAFVIPGSATVLNHSLKRQVGWWIVQNILSIPIFIGALIVISLASLIQIIIQLAKSSFFQIRKLYKSN